MSWNMIDKQNRTIEKFQTKFESPFSSGTSSLVKSVGGRY